MKVSFWFDCKPILYYYMYIHDRFEWDESKNLVNQRKHGVTFGFAARVFQDEHCLFDQDRVDDDTAEMRWHAIGMAPIAPEREIMLLVVHVYREDHYGKEVIRIISARAANKQDVRRYQEQKIE